MKATLLLSALVALAPMNFAQEAPAAPAPEAAAVSPAEQALVSMVEDMEKIATILENIKDKDSADKAAAELTVIREKMEAAEKSNVFENMDQELGMKYMGRIMEVGMKMDPILEKLMAAKFYGSEALKAVLELPEDGEMEVEVEEVEAA